MSKALVASLLGLVLLSSQAFSMEFIRSEEYVCGKRGSVKFDLLGLPGKDTMTTMTLVSVKWSEDAKDFYADAVQVSGVPTQEVTYSGKQSPKVIYSIGDFKIHGSGLNQEPISVKVRGESKAVDCRFVNNGKKPY